MAIQQQMVLFYQGLGSSPASDVASYMNKALNPSLISWNISQPGIFEEDSGFEDRDKV